MCGIFVRIKQNYSYNISDVLKGLKRLEHRGYDSWGLFCCGPMSTINDKFVGGISDIEVHNLLCNGRHYQYFVCMGHTRWATNGEVSKVNTHPMESKDCKIHVVHNGIIENAQELKETYGIKCTGDTDTEVIANVIATHLQNGDHSQHPLKELAKVAKLIEGDNAFVIHYQHEDWKYNLFAFVTGNGILYADDGYISSEINALAGFVHKAVQLKDTHVYVINRFGNVLSDDFMKIDLTDCDVSFNDSLNYIDVPAVCVEMNTNDPMLSEIKEQSQYFSLGKSLPISMKKDFQIDKVILMGCGSSYYAGMFGQRCFEQIAEIEAQTKYATEFMYCSRQYNSRDYNYICISQSGETKDTLDAMGPLPFDRTITITNNLHCSMKRYAKYNIDLNIGPELGVAATKTFFKTCATLAYIVMQQASCYTNHAMENFEEYIQDTIEKADRWAKDYAVVDWKRYLFLGSSLTYPIALEAALKMKEVAYLSAEGMPASEIKHGPIALIDDETLSVFILSEANKSNMKSILSNIEQIRSRHGRVLIICDWYTRQNYKLVDHYPDIFTLPEMRSDCGCEHIISSLACIIPLQLLAYYTAIKEGHNPNRPRNLAKCVTV